MRLDNLIDAARAALPADHPRTPLFTDLLAQLDRRSLSPDAFIRHITGDHRLQALLKLLWQDAEQQHNLAPALWCALLAGSIRSTTRNLTPELLAGLVAVGTPEERWSVEAALAHVYQMPDAHRQASALRALLECGQPVPLEVALEVALSIADAEMRATALAAIIPHAPPDRQAAIFEATLAAVRVIDTPAQPDFVLIALVHDLPADWLREMFATAPERLDRESAMSIDIRWRFLMRGLRFSNRHRQQFLDIARAGTAAWLPIASPGKRVPHLMSCWPTHVFGYALAAARDITGEWRRSADLGALAALIPERLLTQMLAAARKIAEPMQRAYSLAVIGQFLPERRRAKLLAEALKAAALCERGYREQAIIDLAPDLPAELLTEALESARTGTIAHKRARALCRLAARMPAVLPEALDTARMPARRNHVELISRLIAHLPADQQATGYAAALADSARDRRYLANRRGASRPGGPPPSNPAIACRGGCPIAHQPNWPCTHAGGAAAAPARWSARSYCR